MSYNRTLLLRKIQETMKKYALLINLEYVKRLLFPTLMAAFLGCRPVHELPDTATFWVVTRIDTASFGERPGLSGYHMQPINRGDLNIAPVWHVDSVGKWQVGDLAIFGRVPNVKPSYPIR